MTEVIMIFVLILLNGVFSLSEIALISARKSRLQSEAAKGNRLASGIAQTIIILTVTFFTIVLGELVPKRIGLNAAEKVAKTVPGPMNFFSVLTRPAVWVLSASTSAIVKVLPVEQDIVERVFTLGDMQDDIGEDPDIVERAGGDGWLADGQCMMYDFLTHFDLEDEMQDYEYSTIAGLVIDELGHLPEVEPRIDKVIIKKSMDRQDECKGKTLTLNDF